MANSPQRNQQLAELSAGVVADNPEIKRGLTNLISKIITHQEHIMEWGTPAEKQALVKAVLPQMLSAMNTVAQTEAEAQERAAYDRMRECLRGEKPMDQLPQVLKVVKSA